MQSYTEGRMTIIGTTFSTKMDYCTSKLLILLHSLSEMHPQLSKMSVNFNLRIIFLGLIKS